MDAKISPASKLIGKVAFAYACFAKAAYYSFVLYPFVYNGYDALLFRAGIEKKIELRLRPKVEPGWFVGGAISLINKDFAIPEQETKNRRLSIKYAGKKVDFLITSNRQLEEMLCTIAEQFLKSEYKWLNVRKREVVDIGAGFGDTSIYFLLKGAKKVMGFEPYPYAYEIANKNIKINKMENKVLLFNQAVGSKSGEIAISPNFRSGGKNSLVQFRDGKKVRIVTLESIVKKFMIKDGILKVDCEGSEYDILLNSSNATLRKFKQIMIEFHFGLDDLKEKLEAAGFRVANTTPAYFKIASYRPNLYGLMFAERIS